MTVPNDPNREMGDLLAWEAEETPVVDETEETSEREFPHDPMPPERSEALPDYERMAQEDLAEVQRLAPRFSGLAHLSQLPNASRFATLRDMGLTVEEALWATVREDMRERRYDNRSHIRSGVPKGATGSPYSMTREEMAQAKELFGDLGEKEIHDLFRRCKA